MILIDLNIYYRSKFLGKIHEAFIKNPNLENLLFDPFFTNKIAECQKGWREVIK